MIENRRRQNNFICNPDLPWGPVYDSTMLDEGFANKYRFVDDNSDLVPPDQNVMQTIQHLKEIFTQFKDIRN